MFPFKRIAFPIDFSEQCAAAAPYVREMTEHFNAELVLVHAFESPIWQDREDFREPQPRETELKRLREFAAEKFQGLQLQTLIAEGEPGTAISREIQRAGADLVMLPTHGRGTFRRLLIGSVVSKLLHDLDCPVWTGVHASLAEHKPGLQYRSIVCAVGMDEGAPALVKAAGAFAESYKAKLSLIHVVETPPLALEIDFAAYRAELMDAADLRLRRLREEAGIEADTAALEGRIQERIRAEAANRHADLVIVGRGHAQGRVSRLGSKLFAIIRESPCPVVSF